MNIALQMFHIEHDAKIRSELSISVSEKKALLISSLKVIGKVKNWVADFIISLKIQAFSLYTTNYAKMRPISILRKV